MGVTPVLFANQPTPTPQSAPAGPKISPDYNTFLKMLTVQMQNQDPLNPIDSADYAVQLATFSSVEQQTRTNQLLSELNGQFNLLGMAQLAGWVGNEARTNGPVWYGGEPVTLAPSPEANADRMMLVVSNAAGTVVSRDEIPVGTGHWNWQGTAITGGVLPEGRYTLTQETYRDGSLLSSAPMQSYARIIEVQAGPDGNQLVLTGGIKVASSDVTALRSGQSGSSSP